MELRDNSERLMGQGVRDAVHKINHDIAPLFINKKPDIVRMDAEMIAYDGTSRKLHVGANTLLAVSIAVLRAQALVESLELFGFIAYLCKQDPVLMPLPMINIINGGKHAHNRLIVQEIMVLPLHAPSFRSGFETILSLFYRLKKLLIKQKKSIAVGDEGGFAPLFSNQTEGYDLLMESAHSLVDEEKIAFALDVAASHFYDSETKKYMWQGKSIDSYELVSWYDQLMRTYPIHLIEDGLSQHDWHGWKQMMERIGSKIFIIGDDIFATNTTYICRGIEDNIAHGVVVKPNQIGTVTESIEAVKMCKKHGWKVVVSNRSGETNDSFIADFAVGVGAHYIKAGGCSRGERIAKYNRLLHIEELLQSRNT